MNIKLPLYRQEKDNTCALACLRMVLSAFGTQVQESNLEAQVRMEPRGTPIDELERLARQLHLEADIKVTTIQELAQILADGKLPIAFIDRAVFELRPRERARHSLRHAIIHNVIPTQVTSRLVTFHDPRLPRISRRTLRLFERAYYALGGHCIVCSKPSGASTR